MEKEGTIKFADEKIKQSFEELELNDPALYSELIHAFELISKNVFSGRQAKKELIPKHLIQKYTIKNLWIYNLKGGWRLLYTIAAPDNVEVLAIILDWMNHKEYEHLFNFN